MALRVGIDLVSVATVGEALRTHGAHYLARVYTDREVRDCSGGGAPDPARLAARFAAKEAAIKVLRPDANQAVPLRTIEVRRHAAGWAGLELAGEAAALAQAAGVKDLALSITHDEDVVAAVVVADVQA